MQSCQVQSSFETAVMYYLFCANLSNDTGQQVSLAIQPLFATMSDDGVQDFSIRMQFRSQILHVIVRAIWMKVKVAVPFQALHFLHIQEQFQHTETIHK